MRTVRLTFALLLIACSSIGNAATKNILTGYYGDSMRWCLTDKGTLILTGSGKLDVYGKWHIDGDEKTIGSYNIADQHSNGTQTDAANIFPKDQVTEIRLEGNMTNLVQALGGDFRNCKRISVSDVEGVQSVGGVLYSADMTQLVLVPSGMQGEYTVPEGVTQIGNEAFLGSSLSAVNLPTTLRKLGKWCFTNASVEHVVIPEGVDTIPMGTFQYCERLKRIYIPSSVTYIFWMTSWCPLLECIEVSADNQHYCSIDGVLYDKEVKWLCQYPEGKTNPVFQMPVTVEGIENAAFVNNKHIEQVIFSPTLWWIKERAFSQCDRLSTVDLPDRMVVIDDRAFEYCKALKQITMPFNLNDMGDGVFDESGLEKVYWNVEKFGINTSDVIPFRNAPIKEVVFGEGVVEIPYNIFWGAKGLTKLRIPRSVAFIQDNAFFGCTNVTEIIWEAEACELVDDQLIPHASSDSLQVKTIRFGSQVRTIPAGLCKGMTQLRSVSMPASVTQIGAEAFSGCKALVDIQLGSGVRTIGDRAFSGTAILRMTFPEELIRCGHELLADCNNLTDIVWNAIACAPFDQNNTPFYSYNADTKKFTFSITSQIKSVTFGNKVELIPDYLCSLLPITRVNLPSSLLGIGAGAFFRCSSIKQVDIPESVSFIHSGAFFACDSLRSVSLPQSMKRICTYTFKNCSALTDINLPANVQTIEKGAFYGCTAIRQIVLPEHLRVLEDESLSFVNSETPIVIPAELDSVGVAALAGISTPAFEVDKRNTRFKAKNGILYDAKETEVIACPRTLTGKLKISSSVLNIRKGAFAFVQAETVELPGKLTNIEQMSFMYAGIKSITIPKEVKKIYAYTFMKCDNLLQAVFKNPNIDIENGAFESVTQFKF